MYRRKTKNPYTLKIYANFTDEDGKKSKKYFYITELNSLADSGLAEVIDGKWCVDLTKEKYER